MNVLVIDTANDPARLILAQDEIIIASKTWENDSNTGTTLLKTIEAVLNENQLTIADIQRIGVCHGPGRYSSLRAGVITAEALVLATGAELVGIDSGTDENLVTSTLSAKPVSNIDIQYTT